MPTPLSLLQEAGTVLLAGAGSWLPDTEGLLLCAPEQTLVAWEPGQVAEALREAHRRQREGCWVAGYLAYEAGAAFRLPTHRGLLDLPLLWLGVYPGGSERCCGPQDLGPAPEGLPAPGSVELNVTRAEYGAALRAIKQLLAAGDTYQVNYTCRAQFDLPATAPDYFRALLQSHPVPYAAYLNLGEAQVVSLSPELLLQRRGTTLESRPMKGTRPRGRTPAEDQALAEELGRAEKDRAENLMIVDMVRNDLGRVAETGSVQVPALFSVERYGSVWQMTTTVTARVDPDTPLEAIFAAVFPGASVTGAPKHRTMQIIRELEPEPRGVYCGALGVLAPGGDFTFNLPIRTLVCAGGRARLGIGAGIVWDSDPEAEWEETLLKARFALHLPGDLRLFETLRLEADGTYRYGAEHLERLARSARYWDFPLDHDAAQAALEQAAAEAGGQPGVVRLELDRRGGLHTTRRPLPAPPAGPVRVVLSARRTDAADRFLYHKTTRRELYDAERAAALEAGYYEALFLNQAGRLTEGAITNLLLRDGQGWVTPPVEEGLLPGLWRAEQLTTGEVREAPLTLADLQAAREVAVGNSVRGAVALDEVHDAGGALLWQRPGPAAQG